MASQTSGSFNLQYPEATDPVNVHGDIKTLAEDVRDALASIDQSTIQVRVKNGEASEQLVAGTPVYVTGFDTVTIVKKATRENYPVFGLLKNTLTPGQEGIVVVAGVLPNINTSAYQDGAVLYVAETGGLTSVRPDAGSAAVGIVAKSNAVSGLIIVEAKGNGTWGALKDGLA